MSLTLKHIGDLWFWILVNNTTQIRRPSNRTRSAG
jgi:hypothetical protein